MLQATPIEQFEDALLGIFIPIILAVLALAALLFLIAGILYLVRGRRRRSGLAGRPGDPTWDSPSQTLKRETYRANAYEAVNAFLTPAERSLFGVLHQAVGHQHHIFAKVRLVDLINVRPRTPDRQAHFNRIVQKHIDFVLCDQQQLRPLLAIELDDASHNRPDRRQRDDFLDQALHDAGLPLLRIPAAATYNPAGLARQVEGVLDTGTTSVPAR